MIDFFSANLERKRVEIRVKGIVMLQRFLVLLVHKALDSINRLELKYGQLQRKTCLTFPISKVYQWPYNKSILLVSSERYMLVGEFRVITIPLTQFLCNIVFLSNQNACNEGNRCSQWMSKNVKFLKTKAKEIKITYSWFSINSSLIWATFLFNIMFVNHFWLSFALILATWALGIPVN